MSNEPLTSFLTLTPGKKLVIKLFQRACNQIIDRLKANNQLLNKYNILFEYSNPTIVTSNTKPNNLYSILESSPHKKAPSNNFVTTKTVDLQSTIKNDQVRLRNIFKKMDLGLLIKAALIDPAVDALCKHPDLNAVWNERWRLCGRNPNGPETQAEPIHGNTPQSTIETFDLLKGVYIYGKYVTISKKDPEGYAHDYLNLAASLGNFASLNTLFTQCMQNHDHWDKALLHATKAAQLYRTPGYLMLAVLHYQSGSFKEALLNLLIAVKLIPHSESMMNNAYHGNDFTSMVKPLMIKLEVESWPGVIGKLATLAQLDMCFVTGTLWKKASQTVAEIIASSEQTNLPQSDLADETIPEKKDEVEKVESKSALSTSSIR
jgi:tetratricopeptide (TPR) repeat protein